MVIIFLELCTMNAALLASETVKWLSSHCSSGSCTFLSGSTSVKFYKAGQNLQFYFFRASHPLTNYAILSQFQPPSFLKPVSFPCVT